MRHAVRGLLRAGCVDQVIVAVPPAQLDACTTALEPVDDARMKIITAGADRTGTVRSALTGEIGPSDVVLVHDPERPFTPASTIAAVVEAIRAGAPAAIPVEPVTDTIKVIGSDDVVQGTRDRSRLRSAQSPRGFRADVLLEAAGTDPLTELRHEVRLVEGDPLGRRLATPFDVTVMEALLTGEGTT
ncbi:2-C-methyl-D-erythritol 4-phosphate cytidylyltransferase [Prauserella shujinwangii]|uniref:2-C-methyl-D-erythritol 4-phosphate cytidylyltransferase n=1 Tax=Prauserella shujinwangii TaxID=1453103 RepID=A0A2T0M1M9_9PSEU|nr:2-C-methyl-D-erythritol 4-phosphate cytidylyltransferase [Prauserella shujinwangii]